MDNLILVVDDAKFARKIAIRVLEDGGYDNIIEAEDGATAYDKFVNEKPNLTLLDITLKDNTDLTLLNKMLKERPDAKIIMNSAIGQDLIIQDALNAGAKAFITKPFEEKEFLKTIATVLEETE